MKRGFTLVELLVVTGIILLLTAIILPNYKFGERQYALQRSAHKVAQDLRRVQEMAMSAKEYNCLSGKLKGYGIRFNKASSTYPYLAKCNSAIEETETEGELEREVRIKELKKDGVVIGSLDIFFYPPDPEIDIDGGSEAKIILSLKTDPAATKIITVNKAGLIAVE